MDSAMSFGRLRQTDISNNATMAVSKALQTMNVRISKSQTTGTLCAGTGIK